MPNSSHFQYGTVEYAEAAVAETEYRLVRAKEFLELTKKQTACKHINVDTAKVFGNTCMDCNLFLNNGI